MGKPVQRHTGLAPIKRAFVNFLKIEEISSELCVFLQTQEECGVEGRNNRRESIRTTLACVRDPEGNPFLHSDLILNSLYSLLSHSQSYLYSSVNTSKFICSENRRLLVLSALSAKQGTLIVPI
jgi:hypothetical protein